MSNTNWQDNTIQFPRLIAEIIATQDKLDMPALCESMDLTRHQLDELFDRAQGVFETWKQSIRDEAYRSNTT